MRPRLPVLLSLGAVGIVAITLRRAGWENWSLWLDESMQVYVARHSTAEILGFLRFERNHPPLDYFFTHLMLRRGAEEAWLRWAPVFWSVATLPFLFLRDGGFRRPGPALGASFAFAVLPLAVNRGQEIRAYALTFFCLTLAEWARATERRRGLFAVQLGASVAAVYSLYIAFLTLGVCWLLDLADALRSRDRRELRRTLAIAALTVLAFIPWLVFIWSRLWHPHEAAAPFPSLRLVLETLAGLLSDRRLGFAHGAAAIVTAALAVVGLFASAREERHRLGLLFVGILGATGAFLVVTNHWFDLRYFFPALLPLVLLLGEGMSAVASRVRRVPRLAFGVVLLLFVALHGPAIADNAARSRVDWRIPAEYITHQTSQRLGGPVIPVDQWSFFLLSYQSMKYATPLEMEAVSETSASLHAAMERHAEGWIAWQSSMTTESGLELRKTAKPWATIDRADDVWLFRFEHGRVAKP